MRIADVLRTEYELADRKQRDMLDRITRELADLFRLDNPTFDRQRFYDAAGSELIA